MSDFQPTDEQVEALRLFKTGGNLAIQAGAGTGKTRTLQLLAESCPNRVGIFTAFNKAIVTDAGTKMPASTTCATMHSLAMRAVGRRYAHRLNSGRMKSNDIARRLRIDPIVVTYGTQRKPLAAGFLAGLTMRAVARFCQSGDAAPDTNHVPYVDGIDAPYPDGRRGYSNNDEVRRHILPAMRSAWEDLSKVDGTLPFRHEHYLKIFERSNPVLMADFVMVDEAQDLSGVMISIVEAQAENTQLVFVGDSAQSINEWMGAIDALGKVPADETTFLTRSFRFGPAVADVANGLLTRLGADLRLTGAASHASVVAAVAEPACILTRTNAEAVRTVLSVQEQGRTPFLMGGGSDVIAFCRGAQDLLAGRWTSHQDLTCFGTWNEVQEYVGHDPQGSDLALLVNLIDDFGVDTIITALSNSVPEASADVTVSTTHKCVHPSTLVETPEGVMPISDLDIQGTIAAPTGAVRFQGRFTREQSELVTLRTRSGYEVAVTADHGMTVWSREQGRHVRVVAGDLVAGDILRLRLGATIDPEALPSLPHCPARGDVREVQHRVPEWLDEDVAEFLGLMVADGTIYRSGFRMVKRYDSVLDRFSDLCRKLFGYEPRVMATEGTAGREVSSRWLVRWLLSIDGLAPNAKAIPAVVLRAPLVVQAAFMRGLWEDGTVNEKDGRIDHVHWESRSEAMAATMQHMLLRQGVITRRTARASQQGISSVAAFGQNARRFGERVGFVASEKNARLVGEYGEERHYTIPLSRADADSLRPALSESQYRNAVSRGYLSRHAVEVALTVAPDPELSERLRWHYEPVVAIGSTPSESMCVEVPDGHRFLQNGFDGWNSKGCEWDSVQLAGDFFTPRDGQDDVSPAELKLLYVACTRARRELDVTLVPHAVKAPAAKPLSLPSVDVPAEAPVCPQEARDGCPLCGRTDVVRGGLIGAHRCATAEVAP